MEMPALEIRARAESAGSADSSWTVLHTPAPSTVSFTSSDTLEDNTLDSDTLLDAKASSDAFTVTSDPADIGDVPSRGSFSSEIVEVTVGSGRRIFKIHKDVICFYSEYFAAEVDAGVTSIALLSESARTFDLLVHWLYTREVPEGNSHDTSSSTGEICTRMLARLWVFGQEYNIPQLQNDMVTKIVQRVMHSPWKDPSWHTTHAYEHAPDSPLQKLIIDLIAVSNGSAATRIRKWQWSAQALSDLAVALSEGTDQPKDLARWDLRRYHV